ncbi:ABC transporter ATP-binding protein [Lysinibacillus sp. RC79]|uniref:ABC transporter ATP-binding protein n=1 Tax=Lysinibacillus sp. RC79 TaxID=3156296 RepID=UPI003513283A
MLEIKNLTKSFTNVNIISDLTLNIKRGEVYGLIGPNGAGKTTLISIICGLIKPTKGSITFDGENILGDNAKLKKLLGIVPQDIALYSALSAKDNLLFWGRMYNLSGEELKERVAECLKLVGLDDRANEKISTFSGGMKRRINIAAAILHEPELLIMDEPTVGIDPQSRNHILETIKQLNSNGMTVIYTSHYMEEVEYLCDRIGIIDHGKLIVQGTIKEVILQIGNESKVFFSLQNYNEGLLGGITQTVPGIVEIESNKLMISTENVHQTLIEILEAVRNLEESLATIDILYPNLETCFLQITGKSLRD